MAIDGRNDDGRKLTSGPGGINEGTSANELLLRSRVQGDAFDRYQVTIDGTPYAGDGTTRPSQVVGGADVLGNWTDLGNLGATETITGTDDVLVRRIGTLDQACTVTLSLSNNQQVELIAIQDATGLRALTFSGVDLWITSTPSTSTRTAGQMDRFKFEKIAGVTYGYWLTETLIAPPFRRKAGSYCVDGAVAGTMTLTNNRAHFEPLVTYETITITSIGITVSTNVASSTIRFGIVNDDGDGVPGAKLVDFGTVDSGASTGLKEITGLSQVLPPGLYWIYMACQGTGVGVRAMTSRTTPALQFARFDTMAQAAGNGIGWPVINSVGDPMPSSCVPNNYVIVEVPKIGFTITVP